MINNHDDNLDINLRPKQINQDLNAEEKSVLFDKHTERAFTGQYDNFYKPGDYVCKNCQSKLYSSKAKFDAGCGWPAFDDCYPDSIGYIPDADGRRVEIVCNTCKIHLGHVFEGEHLTDKNTRHCVNSISVRFVPSTSQEFPTAILGCGCFWGVEYYFKKLKGVTKTEVGYSGGESEHPDYEDVCSGKSGHYEVVQVTYDPSVITYESVIKYFFEIHDFGQANGQGNDIGEQYKSVIFFANDDELRISKGVIDYLTDKDYQVVTMLKPVMPFYAGELYHQDYYGKNGHLPYCHFYKRIFDK
jgi:peptide methionine sulfoxide reductase msrA/msrB